MTEPLLKCCQTCKFFRVDMNDMRLGACTRYPPQMVLVMTPQGPSSAPVFPTLHKSLCCGEYQVGLAAQGAVQ